MYGIVPFNRRNRLEKGRDLMNMESIFNDFFQNAFSSPFFAVNNPFKADIRETDKEYIIEAEIPGVVKDDINIQLTDDTLTISAQYSQETNEEKSNYIRRERRSGSFSRSFLVDNVKDDDVKAKYENGVLTIKLPKAEEEKAKTRRIDIK